MNSVTSTSATDPLASLLGSATGNTGASTTDASDRFLSLLVAQLRNQDPLNPLDNAQMTSQLAQINTVEGVNKLNATLQTLAASVSANQYLQAASLVGHDVVVAGKSLQLAGGHAQGGAMLQQAVDDLKVNITDASGQVVRQLDLGAQPAGIVTFNWDGRNASGTVLPDGAYSMSISALAGGKAVSADAITVGHVSGVIQGSQGTQLRVGSLGLVNLTDVLQIN